MACPAPFSIEETIQHADKKIGVDLLLDLIIAEARKQCRSTDPECGIGSFELLKEKIEFHPASNGPPPTGALYEITIQVNVYCGKLRRPWYRILWDAFLETAGIVAASVIIVYGSVAVFTALAAEGARDPEKAGEIIDLCKELARKAMEKAA